MSTDVTNLVRDRLGAGRLASAGAWGGAPREAQTRPAAGAAGRPGSPSLAPGESSDSPPSGNTGVGITTVRRERPESGLSAGVGWLSCTWKGYFATLDDFMTWAGSFFGDLLYCEGRRWRGYDHVFMGEHGVMVGTRYGDGDVLEVHLDVPATVLEGLRLGRLVALLRSVHLHAHNVTRLDCNLDDWMKVIMPYDLYVLTTNPDRTVKRDDIVTRAKTARLVAGVGERGGDTWELGSSQGEVKLRVYDKDAESGGELPVVRWELQMRGDWARSALGALVAHIDTQKKVQNISGARALERVMGGWVASWLTSFVDFRDRNSDENISRADRRFWWLALVLDAHSASVERVAPPMTVLEMHEHAMNNMLGLIATLADSAEFAVGMRPGEWFEHVVRLGRERRSAKHRLALRSAGVAA